MCLTKHKRRKYVAQNLRYILAPKKGEGEKGKYHSGFNFRGTLASTEAMLRTCTKWGD